MATDVQDVLGESIKRVEDPRFITGHGRYLDDIKLTGMTHLAILRSPYAHANIKSIDTSAAKSMPGVLAVIVGADIPYNPLPMAWPAGGSSGIVNNVNMPRVLATDSVKWTGEGVAAVVAETPEQAIDALEAIQVDYEPLPAVIDAEKATQPGAPQLHENAPNNVVFTWPVGDKDGTEAAFKDAEVIVKQRIVNHRLIPNPMEVRGDIGLYNPGTEEYTVWMSSQTPHIQRLLLTAFVTGIPEHKVRVIAPDVGGAFGTKIFCYADMALVMFASKLVGGGRPVKWVESRRESYGSTIHGRDHITYIEIAGKKDGEVTGLRVKTFANLGGRLSTIGPGIPTTLYARVLSGCYKIPNVYAEVTGVYTNTTFVDAYRGAGRPEATYVVERAMDLFANEIGMDRAAIRRKNFIPPDAFPYDNPSGLGTAVNGEKIYIDSGNYEPALNKALIAADYDDLAKAKAEAKSRGKLLGMGLSTYIEVCGVAPSKWIGAVGEGWGAAMWESSNIKVHLTGKVIVTMGTSPQGQGHETTYSQVIAHELGVPMDDIVVQHSDTQGTPFGYGSYGSRTSSVGSTAAIKAADKIRDKARRYAAHMLEASPDDIEVIGAEYRVKGSPEKKKTLQEIAFALDLGFSLPTGMEPYLDETAYYDTPNCTWPFGTHIAVVEIDEETGDTDLIRYLAVDDVGKKINPMIVDGQLHGGIAQGVGQALWEQAVYSDEGQLLSGSMMDYALPRASWLPSFELDETVTPSPVNPLGVKGVGEAGAIASTAAVASAVNDALAPLGIRHLDMPYTAQTVWRAIQSAKGGPA
ncbi:MAG TPA: xanthine dehydrogenase family protein molybdopterin-binding subunit [Candidatus Limnocylindrales bacterium]|nr:xanthine dehydrogenase family protein molybdopterin-binding subunit [Candidatus Limnocylindrales bacterium]